MNRRFLLAVAVSMVACGRSGLDLRTNESDQSQPEAGEPSSWDASERDQSAARGTVADAAVGDPCGGYADGEPAPFDLDAGANDGWPGADAGIADSSSLFDARRLEDGGLLADSAGLFDHLADQDAPPSCSSLDPLAARGVLTTRRTKQVLFHKSGHCIVLRVASEAPADAQALDDVLLVQLPSGKVSPVATGVSTIEWFGGDALLVQTAIANSAERAYTLSWVGLDGSSPHPIAKNVCEHRGTPDGSRVYVVRACDNFHGTLDAIDIASGAVRTVSSPVVRGHWVVSPSGQSLAFIAPGADAVHGVMHVVDNASRAYSLTSVSNANSPVFLTDETLLFLEGDDQFHGNVRVHRLGSADSAVIASDRLAGWRGYDLSPLHDGLLVAKELREPYSNELRLAHTDGSGETLLATDLALFQLNQLGPRVFGFTSNATRVVFATEPRYQLAAVGIDGTARVNLQAFGISWRTSPSTDEVAVIEHAQSPSTHSQLTVFSTVTGQPSYRFESETRLMGPEFLPDGRGLVFANRQATGITQLRYASPQSPGSVLLSEWRDSYLPLDVNFLLPPRPSPTIDPTSCFAIVDTDLAPNAGTHLVRLPP